MKRNIFYIFLISCITGFSQVNENLLIDASVEEGFNPIFPPLEFCGDNAAMIAIAGLEKFKLKKFDKLDHPAKPRWPLDNKAAFLKGAGVKL